MRRENAATYSAGNEDQNVCGVFFETVPLQRSSPPSLDDHVSGQPFFYREHACALFIRKLKLKVGEELINNPAAMLEACVNYFEGLAKSGGNNSSILNDLYHQLECLFSKPFLNEEQILDTPFMTEEVESTVSHLKKRKSPGPNGLVTEHLQGGGSKIMKWLTHILNNVVELEAVP